MGFQDRDYTRHESGYGGGGFFAQGQKRMMVTNIVIICVAIFVLDAFTTQPVVRYQEKDPVSGQIVVKERKGLRPISNFLSLKANLFSKPWQAWQLLSYGFAHSSLGTKIGFWHVAGNMFVLWMLGRFIEMKYGAREFLAFYLVSMVVAGLAWVMMRNVLGETAAQCVGASGAVSAVLILFVMNFPHEKILLFFVIPMPVWLFGVLIIGQDMLSAIFTSGSVAHDAHLAGVAFGFAYYKFGWRLQGILPTAETLKKLKPKSRGGSGLRIHDPDQIAEKRDESADRVLDKLHREGQDSLTRKERKILEEYSRRMREKRS